MPIHYYDITYADGGYEQVYRYEDLVACKQGGRKIKTIKEYKYTEKGWLVKPL